MRPFLPFPFACLFIVSTISLARGIEIKLDYSLDSNNFFGTSSSPQRIALRAVADFFGELIEDSLAEIDEATFGGDVSWSARITHPATGEIHYIPSLTVPANTLIVYVGGRPLGSSSGRGGAGGFSATGNLAWFDRIRARGETNADRSAAYGEGATDFGPWGGQLTFDSDRDWNFSLTERRPDGSWGTDFIPTALHEFGHLLGLGPSSDSWQHFTDNSDPGSAVFRGPFAVEEFGGPVPMQPSSNPSHWQDDGACTFPAGHEPDNPLNVLSKTLEQFGTPGDLDQIARMDPSSCSTGSYLKVFTRLDVAALRDVGWTLSDSDSHSLPLLAIIRSPVTGYAQLSWNSELGVRYQIERNVDLHSAWQPLGSVIQGDGNPLKQQDTDLRLRMFYRLTIQ